jgi:hypothetical protein
MQTIFFITLFPNFGKTGSKTFDLIKRKTSENGDKRKELRHAVAI